MQLPLAGQRCGRTDANRIALDEQAARARMDGLAGSTQRRNRGCSHASIRVSAANAAPGEDSISKGMNQCR
jgi:hypothetical protein